MADGDALILGRGNAASSTTNLTRGGAAAATALNVVNQNGSAIRGEATGLGLGVRGDSRDFYGVYGSTRSGIAVGAFADSGYGLFGDSVLSVGVAGYARAQAGVSGRSDTGPGVQAHADNAPGAFASSTNRSGLFATTGHGAAGVQGNSRDSIGVAGTSVNRVGVAGFSEALVGTFGEAEPPGLLAAAPTTFGVLGRSQHASGRGVVGRSKAGFAVGGSTDTGWAGRFDGRVGIVGDFTVFGGVKSAAVAHPDGTHRCLYAIESPESWFEDFGRGELVGGRSRIEFDPDWTAVVRSGDCHVFLTPEGESNGLYVADLGPDGFEVREQGEGRSNLRFSYRVVARRADISRKRFAPIEMPENVIQDAELDDLLPKPPEMPEPLTQLERPPVVQDTPESAL